jgi:hypothetical protein
LSILFTFLSSFVLSSSPLTSPCTLLASSPQIDSEVVYPLVLDLDRRFLSQELQERLAALKRDQDKAGNAEKKTVDSTSYDMHGEIW